MPIFVAKNRKTFYLSAASVSYVLFIDEDAHLLNLHWGKRVPDDSLRFDPSDYQPVASFDLPAAVLPWELPVAGSGWYGTSAVSLMHANGETLLNLQVESWSISRGKASLPGLPSLYADDPKEANTLQFTLCDRLSGLRVKALYSLFEKSGVVTRSLVVENACAQPVLLKGILSATVPFWRSDMDVLHLKGSWARERSVIRTPAGKGEYGFRSQRGASGHEENPFIAVAERNTDEFSGGVWSMNLVYSGSFSASCAVDSMDHLRMGIGLNPDVFSWKLMPGETFASPEAVLVYSDRGVNGMSQTYHALYRAHLCRGKWRDQDRPVLVNNWEATYFDFDEEKLLAIAGKAKEIGAELFVLDDGWFGKRNIDNCSLGDWVVNTEKLPEGLSGLSEKLHALGLKFGLWLEPEMISPDSDLYRAHPDWCLHGENRPRTEARWQLVLDLSRKEVQDYVIGAVRSVLSSAEIDYVKWDMNRNMTEAFSAALPPARKLETQHRYMLGLYRVLEALTSAFPDVLFESCSGGGGRFDPGMLYYMPQTWTSDDTDAVERLKIQYGTSFVYPASAMGAHVSAVPNHQTGRITPLSLRGDVALGGNFGFELDLEKMTDEELKQAAQLVDRTKKRRSLTRKGVFWRLLSPFEGAYTAWAFVSPQQDECLLCVYRTLSVPNTPPLHLQLRGLDPDRVYVSDTGETFPGAMLMNHGISVKLPGDFSSVVLHFHS